ncbi:MAG: guanylate kinase [Firmicutes bacterium]|nr:guanylate kinase [Bacillota bacterium]
MRRGVLMVISGPAGAGKGTLAELLLARDGGFVFSVSATTRLPRATELDGVHYHFLTEEQFGAVERAGEFLETAMVHGHRYGTLFKPVMQMLDEGRDLLLDIDTQGAMSVMSKLAECVTVFILPPSFAELERRLRSRNTENEADIQRRLHNARGEIEQVSRYRYALINETVEEAYQTLTAIVAAERQNTVRYRPNIL